MYLIISAFESAFVTEKRKAGDEPDEIIEQLVSNFNLSIDKAKEKFAKWASEVNVETGLFENKRITIRTNTGFPISIKQDKSNFLTTFRIDNVNNIYYLKPISIYFDSLIRLLLDKSSTEVPLDTINTLCKKKALIDIPETNDEVDIKATEIKFVDEEKQQDFIGMFGNMNIEDNEEDEADDEIDFGDIEFGELGEMEVDGLEPTKKSIKETEQEDEEFDFGDIEFGEIEIGETPQTGNFEISPNITQNESKDITNLSDDVGNTGNVPPSNDTTEVKADLTGLRIEGNNNIFMKRREELQPKLFLKKKSGRFKAYSRACPSEYAKQPVILTGEEKKYIDEKDKEFGTKSYDEHITYGTGDEKFHYICPRFWCLSDDEGKARSISLEEINSGKCGGWDALIPEGSDKIPEGGRIVQFTDKRFHKKGVNTKNLLVYKPFYPSFMGKDKHPDGLCIPCCFGKPTGIGEGDWIKEIDKKGKPYYKNIVTEEISRKPPKIPLKNMYEPVGNGPNGPGPTYQTDKNGNIIMDTIEGKIMMRETPAPSRMKAYESCNQSPKEIEERKEEQENDDDKDTSLIKKTDEAPLLETWPHKFNQLGYLTIALQKFMGYNCKKICQISMADSKLKLNQPCLLQKGIQNSESQSFLACIADAYEQIDNYDNNDDINPVSLKTKPDLTIQQFKQILIDKLSFDIFVTLQNGDLVNIFADKQINENINDISSFQDTIFYRSLMNRNDSVDASKYLNKAIGSYKNFINYINDNSIEINYEYLWDFLSLKRESDNKGGLFKSGLNLIILNSPDDDITSKIELICPTSIYTSNLYNTNKPILILYSKNNYYEPIYNFTKIGKNRYIIKKTFNFDDTNRDIPELSYILGILWESVTKKCLPLFSLPEIYNRDEGFVGNISALSMLTYLKRSNSIYKFESQIVNYNSKVVAILLKNNTGDTIYIPCFPSAIIQDLQYEFIGRNNIYKTYKETIQTLNYIHNVTKKNIPCKPLIIAVSDNIVVGVITQTNQFVPVTPEPYDGNKITDTLKVIQYDNLNPYITPNLLDENLLTNKDVDRERILKVKQIKLESYFYNAFRNMVRIVLSYPENSNMKNAIKNYVSNVTNLYLLKLNFTANKIQEILSKYITFSNLDINKIPNANKLEQCLNMNSENCGKSEYCMISENDDGICKMIFPSVNLINGTNNEEKYYVRLADEIIKFQRMRTFIFTPKTFLSFQEISYSLNDDEIILLEDILYGDYFNDLKPEIKNKYISNKQTWNSTEPIKTQTYINTFTIDNMSNEKKINQCIITNEFDKKLSFGYWQDKGFEDYSILEFKKSIQCSWELFREILSSQLKKQVTLSEIVNILIEIYKPILENNQEILLNIMKAQKKTAQADELKRGTEIENIITTTNYYLSMMDFFFLANHYNIPLILLSRSKVINSPFKYISFINDPNSTETCYIIFSGASYNSDSNKSPNYGLVSYENSIILSPFLFEDSYKKITSNNFNNVSDFFQKTNEIIRNQKRVRIRVNGKLVDKKKIKIKIKR